MVFFICSHCGASLKKSKVEKHYAVECRNAPQVSCMDCHKEFSGNEYVAHIKCITEDEKYSAKGFVPKPTSNKGECKQQEWLDVVRSVQQSHEKLPKYLKAVLDSIVQFENIPKKKAKFMNFVKSNNFKLDSDGVDQLWALLEKEQKRAKENVTKSNTTEAAEDQSKDFTEEADQSLEVIAVEKHSETSASEVRQESGERHKGKAKKKKDKSEQNIEVEQVETTAVEKQNEIFSEENNKESKGTLKEKSKKKKHKNEQNAEADQQMEDSVEVKQNECFGMEVDQDLEITQKEKTKKKKDKTEDVNDVSSEPPEIRLSDLPLTKKQRKEKKKREKYEAELKEIESSQVNDIHPENDEQSKKKKKSKKDYKTNGLDNNVNNVVEEQNGDVSLTNSKKRHIDDQSCEPVKKKKKDAHENEQVDETSVNGQINIPHKFHWNETILEIVKSKGGAIPLKRLRKKVVVEYQNYCGSIENDEKVNATFSKKLLKVPGVTVHKEIVNLV